MTKFVNIATTHSRPLLLDAENISVITETENRTQGDETETTISFSSVEQSDFLRINPEKWDIQANKCLDILADAGTELFALPYVWGDDRVLGRVFVNPAHFNYIITSVPHIPEGETEEHVAILLGVDGYGLIESYKVPVKAVEEFLDLVRAQNPALVRVDPDNATSRFYQPGFVVYDPQKIARITPNGYDIDLIFDNGGRVDFSLPDPPVARDSDRIDLCRTFARQAAQDAPQLVEVQGGKLPFYSSMKKVTWFHQFEGTISFHYRTAASQYGEMATVRFENEADAIRELNRLQTVINPTGTDTYPHRSGPSPAP